RESRTHPTSPHIAVYIEAANLLVDVKERRDRDPAGVEGAESVLDADVVEWTACETGLWIATVDVDAVIPQVAPRALWIARRVVAQLLGELLRTRLSRTETRRTDAGQVVDRSGHRDPADRHHLFVGVLARCELVEVALEQPPFAAARTACEGAVHETAAGHQAIKQARVVLRDAVLLRRTARRSPSNGDRRHAVRLDEMLLRHRHRFGGADVAAIVALHVQRVGGDRVTTREHDGICDASGVVSLLEPAGLAAAAERVDQAAVPRAFKPIGR